MALARRLQFGLVSQHVSRARPPTATADDVGQVFSHLEPHQASVDELGGGQASAPHLAQLPAPHHELEGDHLLVGVAVSNGFREDVPDDDEELAGDGNDGLVGGFAPGEPLELFFPVGMGVDGDPGGLDEDPTQAFAPLLGDAPRAMRLAAVVDMAPRPASPTRCLAEGKWS